MKSIIHENSSKSAIVVCAFLARKIKSINRENTDIWKKLPSGQENKEKGSELKKILMMISE